MMPILSKTSRWANSWTSADGLLHDGRHHVAARLGVLEVGARLVDDLQAHEPVDAVRVAVVELRRPVHLDARRVVQQLLDGQRPMGLVPPVGEVLADGVVHAEEPEVDGPAGDQRHGRLGRGEHVGQVPLHDGVVGPRLDQAVEPVHPHSRLELITVVVGGGLELGGVEAHLFGLRGVHNVSAAGSSQFLKAAGSVWVVGTPPPSGCRDFVPAPAPDGASWPAIRATVANRPTDASWRRFMDLPRDVSAVVDAAPLGAGSASRWCGESRAREPADGVASSDGTSLPHEGGWREGMA